MIEVKLSLNSDLMEKLDQLDASVKKATKETVYAVAKDAYNGVVQSIQSKNLIKTGNLLRSVGFNMQGGGKYNLVNYDYTPSFSHRQAHKRIIPGRTPGPNKLNIFDVNNSPPPPPDNPYQANVFVLARYGPFLEFGTVHMAARPFFYEPIGRTQVSVYHIASGVFARYGLSASNFLSVLGEA